MDLLRERVGPGYERQGDEHLDGEVVNGSHGPVGNVAGDDPEEETAARLLQQEPGDAGGARRLAPGAGREGDEDGEQHDADAVVEQRLALLSTSSVSGTLTFFRVASTATGSVGLMSAPNTSAHASGSGLPMRSAASQNAPPTRAVEIRVPRSASVATAQARSRSVRRSRLIAPANSRKASMPFITTSVKST